VGQLALLDLTHCGLLRTRTAAHCCCVAISGNMNEATHLEDVSRQWTSGPLSVDCTQVGRRGTLNGSADIDLHDQVAVAEVGRQAGGERRVGLVDEVQGLALICCEVAHLQPEVAHGCIAANLVLLKSHAKNSKLLGINLLLP
jgi:hypothetical protein